VLGGIALAVVAVGIWWGWTSFDSAPEPAVTESQQTLTLDTTEDNATGVDAETGATATDMAAGTTAADAEAPTEETATADGSTAATATGNGEQPSAAVAHEKAEAQAAAAAQVINSGPVIIRAIDDSWVRISDGVSGAVKIGIMKAGETYRVPTLPNLKLMTGNAGAIEIKVGEVTLPPLGGRGEVIRNIDLNPESLRQLTKAPAGGTPAAR